MWTTAGAFILTFALEKDFGEGRTGLKLTPGRKPESWPVGTAGRLKRWLLLLDAAVLVLVLLILIVEDAGQLFKLGFFVLTIGTFFWDLKTFAVRGAFWVSLTTVVLLGSIWAGRVPLLELLDIPFSWRCWPWCLL